MVQLRQTVESGAFGGGGGGGGNRCRRLSPLRCLLYFRMKNYYIFSLSLSLSLSLDELSSRKFEMMFGLRQTALRRFRGKMEDRS